MTLNAAQFADFIIETLNKMGRDGWEVVQIATPQVGQQLTGDILVLAKRELPPLPAVGDQMPVRSSDADEDPVYRR